MSLDFCIVVSEDGKKNNFILNTTMFELL